MQRVNKFNLDNCQREGDENWIIRLRLFECTLVIFSQNFNYLALMIMNKNSKILSLILKMKVKVKNWISAI